MLSRAQLFEVVTLSTGYLYPVDNAIIDLPHTYPLDSDLSGG